MIRRLDQPLPVAHRSRLEQTLQAAGLSAEAAATKAAHLAAVADVVATAAPARAGRDVRAFYVPGRIEVLGKHTDYAGGRTMVVAVERGFCLAVRARADRTVEVVDTGRGQGVSFELDANLQPQPGHWSNYPMTVARRIARNFPQAQRGAQIAFCSDLPSAAGMSSSSALMVAVFLALADMNDLWTSPALVANVQSLVDLAGYLGTVENGQTFGTLVGDRGVGTYGGSEDHTAMLCGAPGQISQYAYCPVRFERAVPVPEGCTFAVATSGVAAEKTGAAMEQYNAASRLAQRLAALWRDQTGQSTPHLAAVLATEPDANQRLAHLVRTAVRCPEEARSLLARLEHFVTENQQIVPAAGDALARNDLAEFGRLVDQSQRAAEVLLGNQVPETSYLAHSARQCGAFAASAFGAGFGGSVWALVEQSKTHAFLAAWSDAYRTQFPQHAHTAVFFVTGAGPAAFGLG